MVRPRGVEPPTALQSGAYDGYKPSALPFELRAQQGSPDTGALTENRTPVRASTMRRPAIERLGLMTDTETGASGVTRTPTECLLRAVPLPDWGTDAWRITGDLNPDMAD